MLLTLYKVYVFLCQLVICHLLSYSNTSYILNSGLGSYRYPSVPGHGVKSIQNKKFDPSDLAKFPGYCEQDLVKIATI